MTPEDKALNDAEIRGDAFMDQRWAWAYENRIAIERIAMSAKRASDMTSEDAELYRDLALLVDRELKHRACKRIKQNIQDGEAPNESQPAS